jgi:hypothetical protein
MHDLTTLNWKSITKILPKSKSASNDRAPTLEEIRKLVEYPDRRIKPIVYTMCASGIRVGAWSYLRWKHVSPIKNDKDEIIAAKLTVYPDEPEQYYTFITPEAYNSLKDWMDFRASYGETINGESWLIHNIWRTADVKRDRGGRSGLVTSPKKLAPNAIQKLLCRALSEQGIRNTLPKGVKRYEWKGAHGFRKFFETRAAEAMSFVNVEFLMGHSLGLSESYYKLREHDVLRHYLKAVDLLTINDDKSSLQKQVVELTEKSRQETYVIKGKLAEKEKEIEAIAREAAESKRALADLIDDKLAKYDRLYDEIMRLNKSEIMKIRKKKARQEEMNALAISGVVAMDEIESDELGEEEGTKRAAAVRTDDSPANGLDYWTDDLLPPSSDDYL